MPKLLTVEAWLNLTHMTMPTCTQFLIQHIMLVHMPQEPQLVQFSEILTMLPFWLTILRITRAISTEGISLHI